MARVIITIIDNPDGSVACKAEPNVANLINLHRSDAGLTAGQAYALRALNAIREAAKMQNVRQNIIVVPNLGNLKLPKQ